MRYTVIILITILAIMAFAVQPAISVDFLVEPNTGSNGFQKVKDKYIGHNQDMIYQNWRRGDDYTYYWTEMGYSSWTGRPEYWGGQAVGGRDWAATSMWGGWFWASQFVAPCAQWQKVNPQTGRPDYYEGTCPEWTPKVESKDYHMNDNPQTAWGSDTALEGTILDDLYARVVDNWMFSTDPHGIYQTWKGILDQDLDILFGRYNGTNGHKYAFYGKDSPWVIYTTDTIIDEAMDQQFAYWHDSSTGNSWKRNDNVLQAGSENGITQRIVADFALYLSATTNPTAPHRIRGLDHIVSDTGLVITNTAAGPYLDARVGIDQWVFQWLRDIVPVPVTEHYNKDGIGPNTVIYLGGGKKGIDQLYSSWFEKDSFDVTCPPSVCTHNYALAHTEIHKTVTKGNHDHNPNDGATYTSQSPGAVWDP